MVGRAQRPAGLLARAPVGTACARCATVLSCVGSAAEESDVLSRPGPRMGEAARLMLGCAAGQQDGASIERGRSHWIGPARQEGAGAGARSRCADRAGPGCWPWPWAARAGEPGPAVVAWVPTQAAMARQIVWDIRAPSHIGRLFGGGLAGVGGAVAQGLFRNPLADPYLLGSSSGAALVDGAGSDGRGQACWAWGTSTASVGCWCAWVTGVAFVGAVAAVADPGC